MQVDRDIVIKALAEMCELREEIRKLTYAVNALPSAHEMLVGLFIGGRLANAAGPSAVADTLVPQLVQLAELVTDHCRMDPSKVFKH